MENEVKLTKKRFRIQPLTENTMMNYLQVASFLVAVVHLMYLVLMLWGGALKVACYNIFSILVYALCIHIIENKGKLITVYILVFSEVMLFTTVMTWTLSGNLFFSVVMIGLAPFTGLVLYVNKAVDTKTKTNSVVGFLALTVFGIADAVKEIFFSNIGIIHLHGMPRKIIVWENIIVAIAFTVICSAAFAVLTIEHNSTKELAFQKSQKVLSDKLVFTLSNTVDAKDRYTSGHSDRVAQYSREIARRMGKTDEEVEEIYQAGLLHDVGKIRIPDTIINKNGRLTDEEFAFIKLHPTAGYHILKEVYGNSNITKGARYHHERYDGKGYPNSLSGKAIPEVARIIGVADSYDAMTSNRSYRSVMPQDKVRAEIERCKGSQFDPEIADIMLELIDEDKDFKLRQSDVETYKVLLVDEDNDERRAIKKFLEEEPMYEVYEADNGFDAIKYIQQNAVDLMLIDTNMPKISGFETYDRIRKFSKVPVVFMTENDKEDIIHKAEEYSETDYLVKPVSMNVLKEITRCLIEK